MTKEKDSMDCAVAMLQALNAGKSPAKIRDQLKKDGYTLKQIVEASDNLIRATS